MTKQTKSEPPEANTANGYACSHHSSILADVAELDAKILADPLNTPERFARLVEAQRKGGLLHGDRPLCPFLRPHIVKRSDYEAVKRAAARIAGAIERLVAHALAADAFVSELAMTPREVTMARVDPGYVRACVTSRLDSYLTAAGATFLEYNGESPAGIGDQIVLDQMFGQLPLVRDFAETHQASPLEPHRRLLEALDDTYRQWSGRTARPSIAIVDWDGVPTAPEFTVLQEFFASEGYATAVVDPSRLEYDGRGLSANGRPVDLVYKRVIIHEFLERCDEAHALARAYTRGHVCVVNSFRSKIAHKKAVFAVLSDPRFAGTFTDDELETIERHVPWTRRVRDAAVDYRGSVVPFRDLLRLEKDRLVLKPNDDYGGNGVVIGRDADDEQWAAACAAALVEPFVVQDLVVVRKVSIPRYDGERVVATEMTVDFDPFLFNGAVEGALVRLSPTSLSNVSSGGGETALLVVES